MTQLAPREGIDQNAVAERQVPPSIAEKARCVKDFAGFLVWSCGPVWLNLSQPVRLPPPSVGGVSSLVSEPSKTPLLDLVKTPADLRRLKSSQLRQLADELRQETVDAVAVTGGHLGAGLGVIELTVALHYVFNTPEDRLVWDVGHQAYPHKILTGRRDRIRTLRQGDGLSGFTKRAESEYDPFGAAHSSTSISAGLGMAERPSPW